MTEKLSEANAAEAGFTLEDVRACGWDIAPRGSVDILTGAPIRVEKFVGGRMARLGHPDEKVLLEGVFQFEKRQPRVAEEPESEAKDEALAMIESFNEALAHAVSTLVRTYEAFDLRNTSHDDLTNRRAIARKAFARIDDLVTAALALHG